MVTFSNERYRRRRCNDAQSVSLICDTLRCLKCKSHRLESCCDEIGDLRTTKFVRRRTIQKSEQLPPINIDSAITNTTTNTTITIVVTSKDANNESDDDCDVCWTWTRLDVERSDDVNGVVASVVVFVREAINIVGIVFELCGDVGVVVVVVGVVGGVVVGVLVVALVFFVVVVNLSFDVLIQIIHRRRRRLNQEKTYSAFCRTETSC
jgi:hypothetical protein